MIFPLSVDTVDPRLFRKRLGNNLESTLPILQGLVIFIFLFLDNRTVKDVILQVDGH